MDSWKTIADTQWVCCICWLYATIYITFFHKKKKNKNNNINNNRNSRNNNQRQPTTNKQRTTLWGFPKMVVPPFHTPKWSFVGRKTNSCWAPPTTGPSRRPFVGSKVVMPRRACGRVVLHKARPIYSPPKGNVFWGKWDLNYFREI